MKISMVTGSYPPDICGVGDYTKQLVNALIKEGLHVQVIKHNSWKFTSSFHIHKLIKDTRCDIVHIQYPTIGYGHGIAPQFLSLIQSMVVTLHEMSQSHILRKISLYPFGLKSSKIIFTNKYEFNYAKKWMPWISKRSCIIPIGSNIPVSNHNSTKKPDEIIYFGLIRPNKGLENVLQIASLIKKEELSYYIRIIGMPDPSKKDYFHKLIQLSQGLPIIWNTGLNEKEVADMLASALVAYVPYPDGASERRGSLLALLANGVVTVTTYGKHTPSSLSDSVLFAETPKQALDLIKEVFRNEKLCNSLVKSGKEYVAQFSWNSIAKEHIAVYEQVLRTRGEIR